jgi:hypothetical protein
MVPWSGMALLEEGGVSTEVRRMIKVDLMWKLDRMAAVCALGAQHTPALQTLWGMVQHVGKRMLRATAFTRS